MAITWRNVDAPDLRGVGSLLASGSELMNQGAAQIGDILQRRLDTQKANWDLQAKDNTMAAINQIKAIKDLNQLEGTDLNQILSPYGGQIDAGLVSDAFGNQSNVIAQGMQNEQTVRTLSDQKQYQSAFNQMLQAYGNGDIKTGDAISAQLQNTTYGDEAANASIAARERLRQQQNENARLSLERSRFNYQKDRDSKNDLLFKGQAAISLAARDAVIAGQDPQKAINDFLKTNPQYAAFATELSSHGQSAAKSYATLDNNGVIAKGSVDGAYADLGDKLLKSKNEQLVLAADQNGVSSDYIRSLTQKDNTATQDKYFGDGEGKLSSSVLNKVNKALKDAGQKTELSLAEMPYFVARYEPSSLPLNDGNLDNVVAQIVSNRKGYETYLGQAKTIEDQFTSKQTELNKLHNQAVRDIVKFDSSGNVSELQNLVSAYTQNSVFDPTIQIVKTQRQADADTIKNQQTALEAERKLVSELKARAKQREMPGLSSRTPTNVSVNTAIPNFVAPVGYNPVTRLSDVLDFSNISQNAELYKQWQNDKNVSAADKRSLSAWKRYLAEHTSKK